ncbi:hypothetical protein TWF694_004695 [Orbilia ellipsospora]|uniref:GLEYA adhesin domain-containing protein n=1 Tax=Orbilia ellipsospora TaxID=2528407 RepID=A0AAV9WWU8_9PEZI
MWTSLFFILLANLTSRSIAADCDCTCTRDSCLSALVGGGVFASQATVNDCRSYLWTSITVAQTTVRETVYRNAAIASPTPTADNAAKVKRQASLSVPDYAMTCNPTGYASACECIGVEAIGTTYIHLNAVTETETRYTVTVTQLGNNITVTALGGTGTETILSTINRTATETIFSTINNTVTALGGTGTQTIFSTVHDTVTEQGVNITVVTSGETETVVSTVNNTITDTATDTATQTVTAATTETQPASTNTITDTVTATVTSSVTVTASSSTSSVVPVGTEVAILLTNDTINSQFKGNYLYGFLDSATNTTILGFTSDPSQAGKFYYDSSTGNIVTTENNLPFGFVPQPGGGQFIEQTVGQTTAQCWIDSNGFFRCESGDAIYMAIHNATTGLRVVDSIGGIYNSGCSGPILAKPVPYPSGGVGTTLAATAKKIQLQDFHDSQGPFSGQYVTLVKVAGQNNTLFQFPKYTTNQAVAATFLVDPINGNVFSAANEPFLINTGGNAVDIFVNFLPQNFSTVSIIPCTVPIQTNQLLLYCHSGNYKILGVYDGSSTAYVGNWAMINNTFPTGYTGPLTTFGIVVG